ncbi:MAG: hypothetical protein KGQ66_07515 [Acidobacteriota bacterium]|nr:hypothetical protein [Acidobacteriota bacterium]
MTVPDGPSPAAVDPSVAVRSAVESVRDGRATAAEALMSVDPALLRHFLHARIDLTEGLDLLGTGIPASPGAASGKVVMSAEEAVAAAERQEAVVLVRPETSPEDVLGMQSARGIVTARGGVSSHAAVVARGWGIPAVVGLDAIRIDEEGFEIAGRRVGVGDWISIDGQNGRVYAGRVDLETPSPPRELETLLDWADQVRLGHFAVRANADTAEDGSWARALGAEGIGLCRTEHMFLAEDRLPLVRRLILSDDEHEDEAALADLETAQQKDFEELFASMDGLPVTVRLLDPPLHEFLPDAERLVVAEATGTLTDDQRPVLEAVRRLRETNPMLGTRGVRLGVIKPGLYPMQVRAVCRAVEALQAQGRQPMVELMVPLVVAASELRMARGWVETAEAEVHSSRAGREAISVGTMIETPRAALVAGALAESADFFSFGTNDLTQLTYAFSRDDIEARLLPGYLASGLLDSDPFEVLDTEGVGFLVRYAVEHARAVSPGIKIGACGEQAGDPASARFFVSCGLDYVSCSPFRLPIVRLAVAQALLELGIADGSAVVLADPGEGREPRSEDVARVPDLPPDAEFRVINALRIKGFAPLPTLVDMTGLPEEFVSARLEHLREQEMARFIDARGFWQLTPAGREHHAGLLPGVSPDALEEVRAAYADFLDLNTDFKQLCSSWQLRGDAPNDHTDADYDQARIDELLAHDHRAQAVLDALGRAADRLGGYRARLARAASRTAAGQHEMFTGVMKNSYHDIWMELHEDLICLLGVDRRAEGSF